MKNLPYLLKYYSLFSKGRGNIMNVFGFLIIVLLVACNEKEKTLFSLLSKENTQVHFKNQLTESEVFNVLSYGYFYNGGGVAIGDINNDGLNDIYFSGNMVENRMYLNKGDFQFEDITESMGLSAPKGWKTGVTMADVNGDGLLDIYVCRSGSSLKKDRENLLFINQGDSFKEQAAIYNLNDPGYSTQAAFFDFDNDGDLDMWLLNHSLQNYTGYINTYNEEMYINKLFRNDEGKFIDISKEAGLEMNNMSFGLGIGISDINQDGWLDVYISNDFKEHDYLYLNNKDGTFSERIMDYIGHTSLFSMGVDIGDVNNDGMMDILTLDMLPEDNFRQKQITGPDNYDKYQMLVQSGYHHQTMRNMLQLNIGVITDPFDGQNKSTGSSFSEIGQLAGISNTDWSWAPLFADFDNDGLLDLFVTNGYARDYTNMDFLSFAANEKIEGQQGEKQNMSLQQLIGKMPSAIINNYMYKNNGNLTFTQQTKEWGFDHATISNGAAYGDLDNDGDLDLVVNNINEVAHIYRNNSDLQLKPNNFLKIRLIGKGKNKNGIGAKVQIFCKDKRLTKELVPTRGFQSSVPLELLFGLGNSTIDSLELTWPGGKIQKLFDVAPNQTLLLGEEDASHKTLPDTTPSPWFSQQTSLIDFKHVEDDFVDFKVQRLLPNVLSTQGPHMIKGDINQDGREDIFICGAKGQASEIFIQTSEAGFRKISQPDLERDALSEDIDAVFFDADNDGDLDLLVVSGGYSFEPEDPALQPRLYLNDGKGQFIREENLLPSLTVNASCVRPGDFDQDGDMDLFIGGRVIPGKYPETPESYLLINNGKGQFSIETDKLAPQLRFMGMVTDAVWLDLNGDDFQDLIVVGEWMPIKFFLNIGGKLVDKSSDFLSEPSIGWWNRILAADFDADGDLDLVVGNFGLNTQMKANQQQPLTMLYKDFDNNGTIDPILAYYIDGQSYPAYSRDELTGHIPSLKKRFPDYQSYAKATIKDVFPEEEINSATKLIANRLQTSYLENENGRFVFRELPIQAQFSPIYAIQSLDINGDQIQDLLLCGNLEKTRVANGKNDANYGIALVGDGNGHFEYVPQQKLGLDIKGDVRDIVRLEYPDRQMLLFSINNKSVVTYRLNPFVDPSL